MTTARVSVVRDHRVVPLVPGRPSAVAGHSPWQGIVVERHTIGDLEIPLHEHKSFCLHVQVKGTVGLEWWCDGQHALEQPREGSLILLAPGTSDRLRWEGVSERLIVSVDEKFVQRAAEEAGVAQMPSFANQWMLRDEQLRVLLAEMGREAEAGWAAGSLYGDLLGLSLSHTLLRRHASVPVLYAGLRGGMPMAKLRRVLEYVQANMEQDLKLETLAAEAGMSAFHFARLFRESTGVTPHQHVLDQRMERAKQWMKAGNLSIAEIAAQVGFGSATNLVRSFRTRVGMTPGAWKAAQ